jgi:hypothetical protein
MNLEMAYRQAHYSRGYTLPSLDLDEDTRLKEQAKNFKVTKLPYAGERQCLRFDRRSRRPIKGTLSKRLGSADLTYSDYLNGMHISSRATAYEMRLLYTPTFAASDEQLKLVLAQQAYDYICASHAGTTRFYNAERVPQGFILNHDALAALANKATEARKTFHQTGQQINLYRHISWCQAHGGYMALRATIAYKAWREARDSATIANDLGLNHCAVRQMLNRLCKVARRLGLETFPPHHSAFKDRPIRPYEVQEAKAAIQPYKIPAEEIAA